MIAGSPFPEKHATAFENPLTFSFFSSKETFYLRSPSMNIRSNVACFPPRVVGLRKYVSFSLSHFLPRRFCFSSPFER